MIVDKPGLRSYDLVPDAVLTRASADALDHDPVAKVVSDLAKHVNSPANIALFGAWGSGKSSMYTMLKSHLAGDASIVVTRYDAWKFGGHSLHRNFLMDLATSLQVKPERYMANLHNGSESTRLRLGRFLRRNWLSLLGAFLLALGAGALWIGISAWAAWEVGRPTEFSSELIRFSPSGAVVFGAVIAGLLLSNQTLASAVEKQTRSPLQDSDQFSAAFDNLISHVTRRNRWYQLMRKEVDRIVIFIDELDRCSPEDVVSTLTDLKTFLDHAKCVFIVAADRQVIERSLVHAPQAKPARGDEPYYATVGAFLDKIFQYQMNLPPMRPEALTSFAMSLAQKQRGLWEDLRGDPRTYEDAVYSLVPAHVRSPRRVKVLMNNFATNVRVLESRNMDWRARAAEIAVLTVLETEFPAVIKDLVSQPRLLESLVNKDGEYTDEIKSLRSTYQNGSGTDGSAAGVLMLDGPDSDREQAREVLNAQLDAYLSKVNAAGIPLPTLDLIYIQTAGHAEGLSDSDIASLLDFAADTDPADLVVKFHTASGEDKRAAIRFLTTQADSTFGPGRANIIESACRIAELTDFEDLRPVARYVAGTILGEVPKGRWRKEATPGAILLGLLDPAIADPIGQLGTHAEPGQLAAEGSLRRISPILPALDDDRAAGVEALLGSAYLAEPDTLHGALRDLPGAHAKRLWDSQESVVRSAIVGDDGVVPPPSSARATLSAQPAAGVASSRSDSGVERYQSLLSAIAERDSPVDQLGIDVLRIGLSYDSPPALYEIAREWVDPFRAAVIRDPKNVNRVALMAIAAGPRASLIGPAAADFARWLGYIEWSKASPGPYADSAAVRIAELLAHADPAGERALVVAFMSLAPWISDAAGRRVLGVLSEALLELEFNVAADSRRDAYYELLDLLPDLPPTETDAVRALDLRKALKTRPLEDSVVLSVLERIPRLTPDGAAEFDSHLSTSEKRPEDVLATTRLRVSARRRAGRTSLNIGTFFSALDDSAESLQTVSEWLASNPPLKDVLRAVKKASVSTTSIGGYAASRSISDRSKIWLALYAAKYHTAHLQAVGSTGVDRSVVERLSAEILSTGLADQRKLLDDLLTADLSIDSGARQAATDLAIALLSSGVAGAGPLAVKVIFNMGGAASGRKGALRSAMDSYLDHHPKGVTSKSDIRKLNDLNLLTRRKKNPWAKFLDWFDSTA
ncbi:KAP family P-loop NTPase fold protein [Kribbella sp. CA-293567]|uniref:KAP family P-loop NTPase fold protein n=1 Tax=Kribbella sp. CA-293567 TaxID=3002436 RepID=UPI0022DDDF44|nr:P-loop NTPase fold protein [Kribbella sp. CA-293567]WBQ04446.1 P-loop NTPase fold protein [Kribbella sp. CA-293567]